MYSVASYGEMMADGVRMDAYARALRRVVRPGAVVLDIGTGTGIFALLACQLGARKVHAVEPSDAIELAREIAARNGCGERIEFVQASSEEVVLDERADVVVSDLRGILPLFQRHLASIRDARARHLAPGGVLIPRSDTLRAAVVESEELHRRIAFPWEEGLFGIDMSAGRELLANQHVKAKVAPEHLLGPAVTCATLDYATLEADDLACEVRLPVARDGTGHGLAVWFDSVLAEGATLTNAPGAPRLIYGQSFFPWPRAVALRAGDEVGLRLAASRVGEDYVWTWDSAIRDAAGTARERFSQSDFFGAPLSPRRLRLRAAGHAARLGERGEVDRFILERMDGRRTLGEIAREAASRFPRRFASWREALSQVGELAVRYGE